MLCTVKQRPGTWRLGHFVPLLGSWITSITSPFSAHSFKFSFIIKEDILCVFVLHFFLAASSTAWRTVSKQRPSHDLKHGRVQKHIFSLSTPSPPFKPGVFRLADPCKQNIRSAGWAGLLRSQPELLLWTTIHQGNTRAKQTAYKTWRQFKTLLHSNQKTLKYLFDISGSHWKTKDWFFFHLR